MEPRGARRRARNPCSGDRSRSTEPAPVRYGRARAARAVRLRPELRRAHRRGRSAIRLCASSSSSASTERAGRVALAAPSAELTQMHVVVAMTGCAVAGQRAAAWRLTVAIRAPRLRVSAVEREARGGMVELPQVPRVRRVALRALGAEPAAMHVILCVAVIARASGLAEREIRVTAGARRD